MFKKRTGSSRRAPDQDYLSPPVSPYLEPLTDCYIHPNTPTYSSLERANMDSTENQYQDLTRQTVLDLTAKRISHLSKDTMSKYNRIQEIILDANEFTEVPTEIYELKFLKTLSMASQITPKRASLTTWPALGKIPDGIHKLTKLSRLILYSNAIQELPHSFHLLQSLRYLDVTLNWFKVFPKCLCSMKSLQEIHLSGNYIEVIPKEISSLVNLEVLRMGNNQITVIPDQLCELQKLRCLSLRNNKLVELPEKFCNLKGLLCPGQRSDDESNRRLFLEGNPLEYPPVAEIGSDAKQVFDYMEKHKRPQKAVAPNSMTTKRHTTLDFTDNSIKSLEESEKNLEICVQQYGLIFRERTPADGNCFYHAIADQLTRTEMGLQPQSHVQLRKLVTDYLRQNMDEELKNCVEATTSKNVESYIDDMAKDGVWVDEIVVRAMAKALKRDIHVVPSSPDQVNNNTACSYMCHIFPGGDGRPLLIGHYHEYHYQSLDLPESAYDDTMLPVSAQVQIGNEKYSINTITLDLSNQGLKTLPDEVLSLKKLKSLNLSNNCLISPETWVLKLKELPYLQRLSLREQDESRKSNSKTLGGYKTLAIIPQDLHFACKNLTHLSMVRNKIHGIPKDLCLLENLEVLDLLHNYIRELPYEIQNMVKLKYLGLSSNKLKAIPEGIGKLTELRVLRLSHNELKELPDTICNLVNVSVLSLAWNQLVLLPPKLYQLKYLQSDAVYQDNFLEKPKLHAGLMIEGNADIVYPTKAICDSGTKTILSFLEEMEGKPTDQHFLLDEAKERLSDLPQKVPSPPSDRRRASKQDLHITKGSRHFHHLTDEFLTKLADRIGKEWRTLGTCLEIPKPTLDQCEMNHEHNVKEAIVEMLHKWRHNTNKSEEDMIQDLVIALGEAGRGDLKTKIDRTYKKLSQVND